VTAVDEAAETQAGVADDGTDIVVSDATQLLHLDERQAS
jgi:hypothetical protein